MNNLLKVSVCMITYGHENYIREAINGVLRQVTNFEIELIISDDFSRDKTEDIVRDIIETHPDGSRIKYFRQKTNLGMMKNFVWTLKQCNGFYIALCEGDDYWIDPLKLQKQVDFMDSNREYTLCFHGVTYLDGKQFKEREHPSKSIFTKIDLALEGCFINTPTVLFENVFLNQSIPNWFYQLTTGDYGLFLWLADFGKIHYMSDNMAVYRLHPAGTWSSQSDFEMYVKIAKNLRILFENEDNMSIKNAIIRQNRNNFKFLLFEFLNLQDKNRINQIRVLSSFDSEFDTFLLDFVFFKHLDLRNQSIMKKISNFITANIN